MNIMDKKIIIFSIVFLLVLPAVFANICTQDSDCIAHCDDFTYYDNPDCVNSVIFRTNAVGGDYNNPGTWIAVENHLGQLIPLDYEGTTGVATYQGSRDIFTPEGYRVYRPSNWLYWEYVHSILNYDSNKIQFFDCFVYQNYCDLTSPPELSDVPQEPYSSNNQEVYSNEKQCKFDEQEFSTSCGWDTSWNSDWCYQETATQATSCGGLGSGSYEVFPTETSDCQDVGYLYVNYTIPTEARAAVWKVSHGVDDPIWKKVYNITLPNHLLDDGIIRLRILLNQSSVYKSLSQPQYFNPDTGNWVDIGETRKTAGTSSSSCQASSIYTRMYDGDWNSYVFKLENGLWGTGFAVYSSSVYEEGIWWNIEPECYQNSDCGTDGWIGTDSCNGDDVWNTWRTFTCSNPGTSSSSCSSSDNAQLKETCQYGCSSGACLPPNNVPLIVDSDIQPSNPTTDDNLLGYCRSIEYDFDDVTYYYKWKKEINCTINTSRYDDYFWGGANTDYSSENISQFIPNTQDGYLNFSIALTHENAENSGVSCSLFEAGADKKPVGNALQTVDNLAITSHDYSAYADFYFNSYLLDENKNYTVVCKTVGACSVDGCYYSKAVVDDRDGCQGWVINPSTVWDNITSYFPSNPSVPRRYYAYFDSKSIIIEPGTSGPHPQNNNINIGQIFSSATAADEIWTLDCLASDGQDNSSWLTSSSVTILGIECYNNADCGTDGLTGAPFCLSNVEVDEESSFYCPHVAEFDAVNVCDNLFDEDWNTFGETCTGCDTTSYENYTVNTSNVEDMFYDYKYEFVGSTEMSIMNIYYWNYVTSNWSLLVEHHSFNLAPSGKSIQIPKSGWENQSEVRIKIVMLSATPAGSHARFYEGELNIDYENSVFQIDRTHTCLNPGTPSSQCVYDDDNFAIEECSFVCSGGSCLTDPCDSISCDDYCDGYTLYSGGSCSNRVTFRTNAVGGDYYSSWVAVDTMHDSNMEEFDFVGTSVSIGVDNVPVRLVSMDPWGDYVYELTSSNFPYIRDTEYTGSGPFTAQWGFNIDSDSDAETSNWPVEPYASNGQETYEGCVYTTVEENSTTCGWTPIVCYNNADCGTDGWLSNDYCNGDDVWDTNRTWTCNNPGTASASCTSSDVNQSKQTCADTCDLGQCVGVECYTNADCGTDGWLNNDYCKDDSPWDDLWDTYRTWTCDNPGLASASCSYSDEDQEKEDCDDSCEVDECVEVECYNRFDCGEDELLGQRYCDGKNVMDIDVSWECRNYGTSSSYCSDTRTNQVVETCAGNCRDGACYNDAQRVCIRGSCYEYYG
jgi:hypothetical protein